MGYKWCREVTIVLCVFISTDGWISGNDICIVSSNDRDWLKKLRKYFRSKEKISVSINKGRGEIVINKSVCKPMFALRLNRRFPKRSGVIRQHQVLRNSIDYWELQDFIKKDKYENLCKITKSERALGGLV